MKRIIKVLAVAVLMALLMVTLVSPAFARIYNEKCQSEREWGVHQKHGCEINGWAVNHPDHR